MRVWRLVVGAAYFLVEAFVASRLMGILLGWLSYYYPVAAPLYPVATVLATLVGLLALFGRSQAALLPIVYWAAAVSLTSSPLPGLLALTLAGYLLALAYRYGPPPESRVEHDYAPRNCEGEHQPRAERVHPAEPLDGGLAR